MQARIIKIGNSMGVRIPSALIKQYDLKGAIEITPTEDGILIQPSIKPTREGWEQKIISANELQPHPETNADWNAVANAWDKEEWTW